MLQSKLISDTKKEWPNEATLKIIYSSTRKTTEKEIKLKFRSEV